MKLEYIIILLFSALFLSSTCNDVPCSVCKAFVSAAKKTIQEKFDIPSFLSKVQLICGLFVDKQICDGIIPVYGKVIVTNFIIRVLNKENFCNSIGLCFNGEDVEDSYDFANRVLKIEKPKKNMSYIYSLYNNSVNSNNGNVYSNNSNISNIYNDNNIIDNNSNNDSIVMLYLTDIHLDLHYLENSSAECEKVLCCRSNASEHSRIRAGKFGYPGKCDANLALLDSWAKRAKEIKADILVLGGDNGPHDMWDEGQEEVFKATRTIVSTVKKTFQNLTVFPILGNHEKYPSDLYGENETELLNSYANIYSDFLPSEALETFRKYGYYSTLYKKGLRVVAMNSLLCDTWNMNLIKGDHEAAKKEFKWLEQVLIDSEKNNEQVIILEHIPIDGNFYLTECALRMISLVDRFSGNIKGIFSGHTHTDDVVPVFRYFEPRELISINFVSPSFTTMPSLFPSFRVYYMKGFTVEDYSQFRLNLTKANSEGKAEWKIVYNATSFFNVTSLRDLKGIFNYQVDEKYVAKRYAFSPKSISLTKDPKEYEEAYCHLHSDNFRDFCQCYDNRFIHVETMMSFLDNLNGEWPVKYKG